MKKRFLRRCAVLLCFVLVLTTAMPTAFATEEQAAKGSPAANPAVNQLDESATAAQSSANTDASAQGEIGEAAYYDSCTGVENLGSAGEDNVYAQDDTYVSMSITGTLDYNAAAEALSQLNQIRSENGQAPLEMSTDLLNVAMTRATECAIYYGHTRPNGTDCFTLFPSGNYYKGENIAIGYSTSSAVSTAWKNSSGHFTNMVNSNFTEVGIGCFVSGNGIKTWVQVFAGGRSYTPINKIGTTTTTSSVVTLGSNISLSCPAADVSVNKGEYASFPLYNKNKGTTNANTAIEVNPLYTATSNSAVATYSSGKVYGVGEGSCKVYIGLNSGFCLDRTVNVKVPVTGISLNSTSATMTVGDTKTLTASVLPSNATDQTVYWSSSDPTVAYLSSSGNQTTITAKKAGTATITATCNGKKATCSVTVQAKTVSVPVVGVTMNVFSLNMNIGDVKAIAGSTSPAEATSKEIQWTSSNPAVAGISLSQDGSFSGGPIVTNKSTGTIYIKALSAGTTVLTASAGSYSVTAKVTVKSDGTQEVTDTEITGVSLNKTSLTMNPGESSNLLATIAPSSIVNYTLNWNSSNSSVVRLDSTARNTLTFTALKEGSATITVTAGKVSTTCTITVKKKDEGSQNPNPPTMSFYDVGKSDWFYNYVAAAYKKGLMSGVGNNMFQPYTNVSRAMIVQILYNMQGNSLSYGSRSSSFRDVSSSDWFRPAVRWAASNGIVTGVSDNTFSPNSPVTREQMVTILYRYAQFKKYSVSSRLSLASFSDYRWISSYALSAFEWAYASGIVSGKTGNKLDPQGKATRAETAAIMIRFCDRYNI